MNDIVEDVIDAGTLEIQLLFIAWEFKMEQLFNNQTI